MSTSTQTVPIRYIFSGFDGHGTLLGVARAKETQTPIERLVVRYPESSPELLPKLLYSLNIYGSYIEILDVPINVKNPSEWLSIMSIISQNNTVVMYDHHKTNLQFIQQLPQQLKLIQFDNTVQMAKTLISSPENLQVALIGSICDRDAEILKVYNKEEVEKLVSIANAYDYMIRSNLTEAVKNVYERGYSWLESLPSQVTYPPSELVKQLQLVKRTENVALVDATNARLLQWMWKTYDEYMRINNLDYLVVISRTIDRQINAEVPVVFAVKYWLSDVANPLDILKPYIGTRKMMGHEEAFSVSATSESDARDLAEKFYNALTSQWSSTARALGANVIGTAVQNDFKAILQRITQIMELQQQMYSEYLALKREQVNLLKQTDDERRRRYD